MGGPGPGPLVGVADEPLSWRVHPAARRPAVAVGVCLVCAASSLLASMALGGAAPFAGPLFFLALLGSVSGFLLPTRYELASDELHLRTPLGLRRRRRDHVRRVDLDGDVALLSPFATPRALDRFRGVLVRLEGAPVGARERLVAWGVRAGEATPG